MIKILVPTDFSSLSVNALNTASSIARNAKDHQITIVNVYERKFIADLHYSGGNSSLYVDKKSTLEILEERKNEMRKLLKIKGLEGLNVKSLILADIEVEEIIEHEKIEHQNLIVMGTHGMKGTKDFFLGSNTQKMMRMSDVPVLSIKESLNPSVIKRVVFVSDFKEQQYNAFKKLLPVLQALDAQITLLKIITPTNFEDSEQTEALTETFKSNFEDFEIANVDSFNSLSIEDGVRAYVRKHNIDLVSMTTHGRTGFAHLLFGSVSEEILEESLVPLLSVKQS